MTCDEIWRNNLEKQVTGHVGRSVKPFLLVHYFFLNPCFLLDQKGGRWARRSGTRSGSQASVTKGWYTDGRKVDVRHGGHTGNDGRGQRCGCRG